MNKIEDLLQTTGEQEEVRANPTQSGETLSAKNEETLARLIRVLDYAEGFTLLFARCNVPILRRHLISLAEAELQKLGIRVLKKEFDAPVQQLRDVLREWLATEVISFNLAQITPAPTELPLVLNEPKPIYTTEPKIVLFVSGLEHSIPYDNPNARLLAELNLGREFFQFDTPYPLLIWLPDYAITAVVKHAPDFWSWNSGTFEFVSGSEVRAKTLEQVRNQGGWQTLDGLNTEQKRKRQQMLENLLDEYKKIGPFEFDTVEQFEIFVELGKIYAAQGNYRNSIAYYQQALEIQQQLDVKTDKAGTFFNIATLYSVLGEKQTALSYYHQALTQCRYDANLAGEAAALNSIGGVLEDLGWTQEALSYFEQALILSREIADQRIEMFTLINLAGIFNIQGRFQEALDLYQEALAYVKQINDQRNLATILNNIGFTYANLGQKQQSLDYYKQSLDIKYALGNYSDDAVTLNNIGGLYNDLGDLGNALQYYKQALTHLQQSGDAWHEAITHNNLANVYLDRGDAGKATIHLQEAVRLAERVAHPGLQLYKTKLNQLQQGDI